MPKAPKSASESSSEYRRSISPLPGDPLEQARKYSAEQRDKARDIRRQLDSVTDDSEEITKTELHVHMHSSHELELPTAVVKEESERKPIQWIKIVVGAAVTAALAWLSTRFGVQTDHR